MDVLLALLPLCVLATATLSGVFGMAGGMALMGIYAACLPVRAAMVLHGVTQGASNGSRAWLFRHHIYWPAVRTYLVGALPALGLFLLLEIVVERSALFLLMGGLPFLLAVLPRLPVLRIETPAVGMVCGFLVTAAQLGAGVSGPLLDVFFVQGRLTRYQVIGTKALTQACGHVLKLLYHGSLVGSGQALELPPWIFPLAVACAFAGSAIGKQILRYVSEASFQRWSTRLVLSLSLLSLWKGLDLLGAAWGG